MSRRRWLALTLALACSSVYFLVLWVWEIRPIGRVWQYVPEWLASVGTLAAVYVALQERGDRREAEGRLQRAEDERRISEREAQARSVHWWVERTPGTSQRLRARKYASVPSSTTGDAMPEGSHTSEVDLHILNSSGAVIRACVTSMTCPDQEQLIGTLPPGHHLFRDAFWHDDVGSSYADILTDIAARGYPYNWLEFIDTNDQVWRRMRDGSLQPRDEPVNPDKFGY